MSNTPVPVPGAVTLGTLASPEPKAGTILPSASYGTGATNSSEMANTRWRGVILYINTTAVGGAGTVVVKVQTKDPTSGTFVDLPGAATASITTNTETTLTVYPSVAESAGVDISDPLGHAWRIVATVGGNAVTFSVAGVYLD